MLRNDLGDKELTNIHIKLVFGGLYLHPCSNTHKRILSNPTRKLGCNIDIEDVVNCIEEKIIAIMQRD
jgi:hypothetical protein